MYKKYLYNTSPMYKRVISIKILRRQTNGHGFLPKSMPPPTSFALNSMSPLITSRTGRCKRQCDY
ncbi:hypothetical protein HanIR_Chr09g0437111 [Helianthus annuus]|uniref:Uncharacterized protein n=1 Tax=Helianthus annuus TaxID=4232 RepID=A0A251TYH4_HELAN|nr:hypothetical protein HanIR_Chr09g0437111 [Helianthus annuus]